MTLLKTDEREDVLIAAGDVLLEGHLKMPEGCRNIVLFVNGSASSRFNPRNRFVASKIHEARIATLLLDLLTPDEDESYRNHFEIERLRDRLMHAISWVHSHPRFKHASIGLLGESTGAAAALKVAASGEEVRAIVSRGGRPDLAGEDLSLVKCPTLLIVGEIDDEILRLNRRALNRLNCEKKLEVVPGATHLFEEPGDLERAARLAADWFKRFL
jgi:putative phosphoribosyl transferase